MFLRVPWTELKNSCLLDSENSKTKVHYRVQMPQKKMQVNQNTLSLCIYSTKPSQRWQSFGLGSLSAIITLTHDLSSTHFRNILLLKIIFTFFFSFLFMQTDTTQIQMSNYKTYSYGSVFFFGFAFLLQDLPLSSSSVV